MSFDDLPETWPDLPLDDPLLAADVVDLVVGHTDRVDGCAAFLLLEPDLRLRTPFLVGGTGDHRDPWELRDGLVEALAPLGLGGVVLARGRDGSVLLTDADRTWHEMVLDVCRRVDLPLVAAFVATPSAVRSYPGPLSAVGGLAS
ncbi:hypothetical protein [Arthrobacter sp. NEB 688]|uniref:hypothetical protein n=1 Tax=Arthrobacter sp. NEB 688 TaxID=904039 RepID=UPI001565CD7A|nr:hypothetical protein [Arthrobacter sp. NEB 688]QKE83987.1 hypothetical protein HL663_08585 [Arthrobacter sp. NEB 688]